MAEAFAKYGLVRREIMRIYHNYPESVKVKQALNTKYKTRKRKVKQMPVKKTSNRILANNALIYLSDALKKYPHEKLQDEISELRWQNENRNYTVAVAGDFKRGKSSLINALLGMPILPMGIEPMTATLNRITYGLSPKVLIKRKDQTVVEVDIRELADYVTKNGIKTARTIQEAVIEYPTMLCQNGIDILDTPGLNDDKEMTSVADAALHQVHAAVIAVSATLLFSESESQWTADLIALEKLEYLMFAVTFIDRVPEKQRPRLFEYFRQRIFESVMKAMQEKYTDREELIEKAQRLLNPETLVLIPVSPVDALDAFDKGDDELLQESNLPEFKKQLMTLLTAQQEEYVLCKTRQLITAVSEWISQNKGNKAKTDHEHNAQTCEKTLHSLQNYPQYVRDEIEKMAANLKEQTANCRDAYSTLVENINNFLSVGQMKASTNEQLQALLESAETEARSVTEVYYAEKYEKNLIPVLNRTVDTIIEVHKQLYQDCTEILEEVPVLKPTEELQSFLCLDLLELLPVMPPEWTLAMQGGALTGIAKGFRAFGKNISNKFGRENDPQSETVVKAKVKSDGFWEATKIKEMFSKADELTKGSLAGRNLTEMVKPKLSEAATQLHQQWQNVPDFLKQWLGSILITQEDLESNHNLEMALHRKAGELAAQISKNEEKYQEALNHIKMAENALS